MPLLRHLPHITNPWGLQGTPCCVLQLLNHDAPAVWQLQGCCTASVHDLCWYFQLQCPQTPLSFSLAQLCPPLPRRL